MGWNLDVSIWNLGCAAVLLAACGPTVSTEGSESDASTTTDDYDEYECDEYCCGAAVQEGDRFRCGPFYECYSDSECDYDEMCTFGSCVPRDDPPPPPPPDCPIPMPVSESPVAFAAGGVISGMAAADVDVAAGVELLVARDAELQMVVESQAITMITAPSTILAFASGDLDGDGDVDLVTSEDGDAALLRVWWHEEAGFVEGMSTQPLNGGSELALGDADGDGDLDVFARISNFLYVYQLDAGVLGEPTSAVTEPLDAFALLDADADARTDVVYASGGTLSILPSTAMPASTNLPDLEVMQAIVLGDFSADGTLDLFMVGYGGEPIQASVVGPLFSDIGVTSPIEGGFDHPAVGELDGDGHADVVIAGDEPHLLVRYGWLAGNIKTGPMQPFHCDSELPTSLAANRATLADFDGDGRDEIAITDNTNVLVLDF